MTTVFGRATLFNQNIGYWDTSKVTDMEQMFFAATTFNQNISTWNMALVAKVNGMFQNSGMSSGNNTNYVNQYNRAIQLGQNLFS
jgi:surface protein